MKKEFKFLFKQIIKLAYIVDNTIDIRFIDGHHYIKEKEIKMFVPVMEIDYNSLKYFWKIKGNRMEIREFLKSVCPGIDNHIHMKIGNNNYEFYCKYREKK